MITQLWAIRLTNPRHWEKKKIKFQLFFFLSCFVATDSGIREDGSILHESHGTCCLVKEVLIALDFRDILVRDVALLPIGVLLM